MTDLLNPTNLYRSNYVHQLRQTISAYSASMIVIGEALQNAIDAVCKEPKPERGKIIVSIDFDAETVMVSDNGVGFPQDIKLLYLGGTNKIGKTKGKIGVGIKVTLFSSSYFQVRSLNENAAWKIEIKDAYNFENLPSLTIPDPLPSDPKPLTEKGTQLKYIFPKFDGESLLDSFVREVIDMALPNGIDTGFGKTIRELPTGFPSPFSALLASFLRKYSYVGDVLAALSSQENYPANGIELIFTTKCSNPKERFGEAVGSLFGNETSQTFSVEPSYLHVEDSLEWVPRGKKAPQVFNDKLGPGGTNLTRTDGFNVLLFSSAEEYESLVLNKARTPPPNIDNYRRLLFPKINGILLTIGRIPDFETYLPGGSRRVISCNGVVTNHDIDLTKGRNQEYVRCFDLVIDVDGELNYGKTQLTNPRLVKLIRDYVNDAYGRVLQTATGEWVGKMPKNEDDETDIFLSRPNLGLSNYATYKVPRDENDVIGLFFEMAGRGIFPDYRIFGLSQKDVYDCRAAIRRESEDESVLTPTEESKLKVVEFKVRASEVIRDFDRSQKFAREIDLLIAWEIGSYESKNYSIYDIDQSQVYKSSPKRVFPRVTKYIYDAKEGAEVQILILQEIVEQLKEK